MTSDKAKSRTEAARAQGDTGGAVLGVPRADLGILPLIIVLPFMFFPRLIDGDTQLWVLLAALVALVSFRVKPFFRSDDGLLLGLSVACALAFAARSLDTFETLRAWYTHLAFLVLWIVCRRERGDYFGTAIRATVVVWLTVGLLQYATVAAGLQIEFFGRYVAGRSGVPSLTPEPSMYGSYSVFHMLYLLAERKQGNNRYVAAAAVSVILSGSVLAMALLIFPFLRLSRRLQVLTLLALPLLVVVDFVVSSSGILARLMSISTGGSSSGALSDASLNLRIGHVYFTLWVNLWKSLTFQGRLEFMEHYNDFAIASGVFIETGSNFILPVAGELVYGSGILGLALIIVFLCKIYPRTGSTWSRFLKFGFIVACLFNPVSISNAFLLIYALQKEGERT